MVTQGWLAPLYPQAEESTASPPERLSTPRTTSRNHRPAVLRLAASQRGIAYHLTTAAALSVVPPRTKHRRVRHTDTAIGAPIAIGVIDARYPFLCRVSFGFTMPRRGYSLANGSERDHREQALPRPCRGLADSAHSVASDTSLATPQGMTNS
jgi:hypothetical protein